MLAFDTNLAVHAAHSSSPRQQAAAAFITSLARREDVVVCELMLVELYLKLRNEKIFSRPMTAPQAAAHCQGYRRNPRWRVIENGPVMEAVWRMAAVDNFAFRRIIDARLATTLRHSGVTDFATANVKDFQGFGFNRVWNPLDS